MAQQTPWLRPASFAGRVTLPGNFNYSVFDPFVLAIEEDELRNLLGEDRLTNLLAWVTINPYGVSPDPDVTLDLATVKLYNLVVKFLVYAVYAEYVFQGDLQPTDTGMVRKDRENSESITDPHRTQLYRAYRDKAARRAADIAEFLKPQAECGTTGVGTIDVRISSSRGRTVSGSRNW